MDACLCGRIPFAHGALVATNIVDTNFLAILGSVALSFGRDVYEGMAAPAWGWASFTPYVYMVG